MARWDVQSLAHAAAAEIRGGGKGAAMTAVDAVGTDTRALPAGCLFVALRGENFDGHAFAEGAVRAGAHAVLCDQAGDAALGGLTVPRLVVADTLRGLQDIAAWVRQGIHKPVAAISGSNGKTTTKELLAAALATRGVVHKTEGNLNNFIGVPMTLLRWQPEAWAAVVEMGMNAPGELTRLAEVARPNVGLVTCVASAHLEGLGTIENVAHAKAELYAGLPADATVVLNADDAHIGAASQSVLGARKVLRFGTQPGVDVRVSRCVARASALEITLEIAGRAVEVTLPLVGQHNAMNAAGAAAAAYAMGIDPDAIAKGLAKVSVPGSRLRILRHVGLGVSVVDDTYNANPGSMVAAFATLRDLAGSQPRVAVLGDMFELGDAAPALHREVGAAAAAAAIPCVLAVGAQAEQTAAGARSGGAEGLAFSSIEALYDDLHGRLEAGAWVLVKGSRGMKMERLVDLIVKGRG